MDKVIECTLNHHGVKKNKDVTELYLALNKINCVSDLSRFKYLKTLWLNDNNISTLLDENTNCSFLCTNFRLSELYLQNNDITTINKSLSHLSCLRTLFLQNNQLADLDYITQELRPLHALEVLNLFDNPVAQVPGYRLHIIYNIPSIKLLDRQAVTSAEKNMARRIYEEERESIKSNVAFGRRSLDPPIHQLSNKSKNIDILQHKEMKNNPMDRTFRRSLMQYTAMDWLCVPTGQQKRLGEVQKPPQNITVKFR